MSGVRLTCKQAEDRDRNMQQRSDQQAIQRTPIRRNIQQGGVSSCLCVQLVAWPRVLEKDSGRKVKKGERLKN